MKRKTKVKIMLICIMIFSFITLILYSKETYATVECKPSKNGQGTDALVNTTISNSYLLCRGMTGTGGTLYGSSVEPHLATNKDWGAVSYLSNSAYGTNTSGGNTGIEVTINNVKYYSTNGNKTGIMNWGANPNKLYNNKPILFTQTSGIIKSYDLATASSSVQNNVSTIYENKDTRFVDIIDINDFTKDTTTGKAMKETSSWYKSWAALKCNEQQAPCSIREGIFGYSVGYGYDSGWGSAAYYASGTAYNNVTFRPVVWNQ